MLPLPNPRIVARKKKPRPNDFGISHCPGSTQKNCLRRRESPTSPAVQSKPQLLAWITCDGVHIDPGSGKHTLLGVFSNIKARRFPVVHPRMVWFITLTDLQVGKHVIRILFGHNIES